MAFVALFTVVGSIVRDLNLLAILSGLILGVLVFQWRLARANLMGLAISRRLPREVFAGQPVALRYTMINQRKWMGGWHIRIQDRMRGSGDRLTNLAEVESTFPSIASGDRSMATIELQFKQRGVYQLDRLRVATEFPFGLLTAYCDINMNEQIIVFPQLGTVRSAWLSMVLNDMRRTDSFAHAGTGGGEFYGLRPWRNGDSCRWIHWRTTAKIGDVAVCQFERPHRQRIGILLDLISESSDPAALEKLIGLAATAIDHWLRNPANQLSVATTHQFVASAALDRNFRTRVFTMLATAQQHQPSRGSDLDESLHRLLQTCLTDSTVLVMSLRDRPADLEAKLGRQILGGITVHWVNIHRNTTDASMEQHA